MSNKLPPLQDKIYKLLKATPDQDVAIDTLYNHVFDGPHYVQLEGERHELVYTSRDMQQRLGPVIARLNLKLRGQRIVPGELKRTYRLNTNYTHER